MTDNEIVKVLECCRNGTCRECPYVDEGYCGRRMISGSLDLIKRQQAEIEEKFETIGQQGRYIKGLKEENEKIKTKIYKMAIDKALAEKARAEAIKEFADKLKAIGTKEGAYDYVSVFEIDNLVKEMAGADNG